MVSEEFSLFGQTRAIDTMGFEDDDGQVRCYRDNHQRHQQTVAPRQLGNEEHARQRSMHHARHHTGHAHQGKILLRDVDTYLVDVPQPREEEAREAAHEEAGCKGTATASTAIRSRGGHNLGQNHQRNISQQQVALAGEERVVQYLVPVSFRAAVQQHVDTDVTFAIESWEQEDEQTQDAAPDGQSDMRMGIAGEDALAETHHTDEVKRHQTTGNTQQHTGWSTLHRPLAVEMEREQ